MNLPSINKLFSFKHLLNIMHSFITNLINYALNTHTLPFIYGELAIRIGNKKAIDFDALKTNVFWKDTLRAYI